VKQLVLILGACLIWWRGELTFPGPSGYPQTVKIPVRYVSDVDCSQLPHMESFERGAWRWYNDKPLESSVLYDLLKRGGEPEKASDSPFLAD